MRVELLVLMLFVCMAVGEFFSTYSNDKLCDISHMAGKDVETNILRGVSYTLRFLNGNCSWKLTIEGTLENVPVSEGPERIIEGTDATSGLLWKCFVGDDLKLQALVCLLYKRGIENGMVITTSSLFMPPMKRNECYTSVYSQH